MIFSLDLPTEDDIRAVQYSLSLIPVLNHLFYLYLGFFLFFAPRSS